MYNREVKWYRLAAEQGYAKAQFNLAVMYYNGHGIKKDYILSHMWANLAASMGNKYGREVENHVMKLLTKPQHQQALKLFRECLGKKYKGC